MVDFILNLLLWTCALYGLIEIIKNIYYIFSRTNLKTDGIYLIVACKNQENNINSQISLLRAPYFWYFHISLAHCSCVFGCTA